MPRTSFDHVEIEKKAQQMWGSENLYSINLETAKNPYYLLFEFPYPSGDLHIGHWYAFALTDIYARYLRMTGKDVLFPIGFDAFGLPAENAAMKNGADPKEWTYANMERMRTQIRSMGTSVDWSKEVVTCEPDYYRWTQWLFTKLYDHGLAERREAPVKWCPKDQTVLANEQVVDGTCERCGTEVEEKRLTQWFMRITDYAERLLTDLHPLPWREEIKEAQRAWIGKSEGAKLTFGVQTKNIKRFVLLHGRHGSPDKDFFPWLKSSLEDAGYEVQVPTLPNTEEPNDDEQTQFVKENCTIDEQTVLVGHSFGGIVALRLLEQGMKVAHTVLISTPFSGKFIDGKERASVTTACEKGFDAKVIKNSGGFTVLFDTNDPVIPQEDGVLLAQHLGTEVISVAAQETHFNSAEEPAILKALFPSIEVFTTRPDTIFGVTYVVLAPEHPLITKLLPSVSNAKEVIEYRDKTSKKTERERSENKEKTGVVLKGVTARNAATKEEIPIYVADYVLATYGTGAVMAVPAHDERDFEFAKKYHLPLQTVIEGGKEGECYGGDGTLVNSGPFSGRNNREAFSEIVTFAEGLVTTNYRIRDWLVSRQRYWGCPIPMVYDPEGKAHAVPAEHLPWLLPTDVDFTPNGKSPLASSKELKERVVKIFGEGWTPEYDTLDTFVDSSWYYTRYLTPHDESRFSDPDLMKTWLPVDRYSGGSEHTTMHLLYARFFHKALYDLSLVPTVEPFNERFNRGLILGTDGAKMSKSKGNVVNPDEFVAKYGADAVRIYLAFIGPYNEPGSYPWSLEGVEAMRRFLDRVFVLSESLGDAEPEPVLVRAIAKAVSKVGTDTQRFKFNTAISAIMILVREFEELDSVPTSAYRDLVRLLAPFAPHLAEHLWSVAGGEGSVHTAAWPVIDESILVQDEVTIIVQVNGKRRGEIQAPTTVTEEEAMVLALALPAVASALGDQPPARKVYVPGRILNLVSAS